MLTIMRTRTRNTVATTPGGVVALMCHNLSSHIYYPVGLPGQLVGGFGTNSIAAYYPSYISKTGVSETISDELGSMNYNDVVHSTKTYDCNSAVDTKIWSGMVPNRVNASTPNSIELWVTGSGSMVDYIDNGSRLAALEATMPTNEQLKAGARGKMKWDSIEPHINLPRSIAELKDFSDVFQSTFKNLVNLKRYLVTNGVKMTLLDYLDSIRVSLRRTGGKLNADFKFSNVTSGLDYGISADLAWKFAVKPLIADINSLLSLSKKAEELMKVMRDGTEYPVRGRTVSTATQDWSFTHSSGIHVTGSIQQTATCVAYAKMSLLPLDLSYMGAIAEMAALRFQWRTLWELYPGSFIVDWIVKVGNLIGYYDKRPVTQPYRITQSGYSFKRESATVGYCSPFEDIINTMGATPFLTPVKEGVVSEFYTRTATTISPSEWSTPPPLQYSLPSFGQVGTFAELVYKFLRER